MITTCKPQEWDSFLKTSPQRNIFASPAYLDSLGIEYELLLFKQQTIPCLGAIILKENQSPIIAPYHYSVYQGVFLSGITTTMAVHRKTSQPLEWIGQFLSELENQYPLISFCHHPSLIDMRSFQWFHYHQPEQGLFEITIQYTGIIELESYKDFATYLSSVRTDRRQNYRKAQKLGLKISESTDIQAFMNLYEQTFSRQDILLSPAQLGLVKSITQAAMNKDYGKLWLCTDHNGIPHSAVFFISDHQTSYYLFGATNPDYRSSGGSTFLLMEYIRQAMSRGVKQIDMVGVNSPNRGDYKISFNAAVVPYYITTWKSLRTRKEITSTT